MVRSVVPILPILVGHESDLTGNFCTSLIERLSTERNRKDAEENVYARADSREATADRSAGESGENGAGHESGDERNNTFEDVVEDREVFKPLAPANQIETVEGDSFHQDQISVYRVRRRWASRRFCAIVITWQPMKI
jgi:hypothetical protein